MYTYINEREIVMETELFALFHFVCKFKKKEEEATHIPSHDVTKMMDDYDEKDEHIAI